MSRVATDRQPSHSQSVRGSVLVVDDEPFIGEVVSRYLERAGYATQVAHDGASALNAALELRPDLVVLDLKLPRLDGLEVMRQLRAEDRRRPAVIVLSGKAEPADRVAGLRSGADDYVAKPFSPAELVARVDAVLRRVEDAHEPEAPLVFGELRLDPVARRAFVGDAEARLTQREFELLLFLAGHPGRAFSRDELIQSVWKYSFYTDTSTVNVHMRRLRSKVEPDPTNPRHLKTVWGVGYRFDP